MAAFTSSGSASCDATRIGKFLGEGAMLSIVGDAEYIDVDGVERPAQNSNGKPIHPTDDGIRNFWRWQDGFNERGNARSVLGAAGDGNVDSGGNENTGRDGRLLPTFDEAGRPRYYYHGTADDFDTFDTGHENRKDKSRDSSLSSQ